MTAEFEVDGVGAWARSAPSHWHLAPLGTYFEQRNEQVSDTDFPPLSVTKGGVIPQMENVAKTDNNDNRKLVRIGDFAINSRSDRKGSAGVSPLDGSVSVIYTVLTPRASLDGKFVHHLLRSEAFQEEFYRWGSGIVADLWSTRYSVMKRIPMAIPPLDEQRAITDYLDRETARIDALIEEQRRLIETLRERRQAVIETMINGTPPQTTGQRLKHVVLDVRQGWSPQCYPWSADGVTTWGVLKAGAVNGGTFRADENKELPETEVPRPEAVVQKGQLVVSRANTRELAGSAAVVDGDYPRLMLCDKLYGFTLDRDRAVPDYVASVLGTRRWRGLIELEASGSSPSMQNISQADILNLPMDIPPPDEQRRIAAYLDEQTAKIDALIAETETFIELSRERRSALITAAVTGQIDVRGSA